MHAVNRSVPSRTVLVVPSRSTLRWRPTGVQSVPRGCARACDTFSRFLTLRLVSVMRMRCTY